MYIFFFCMKVKIVVSFILLLMSIQIKCILFIDNDPIGVEMFVCLTLKNLLDW